MTSVANSAVVDGVAGAAAGMVALTISYPLMTISTQQSVGITGTRPSSSIDTDPPPPPTLRSRLAAFLALYRGLQPALIGTVASQGVYFYLYASFRRRAALIEKSTQGDISTLASLLVAAAAGALNVLATNPIWLISTRMQVGTRSIQKTQVASSPSSSSSSSSSSSDLERGGEAKQDEAVKAVEQAPPHHGFFTVSRDLYQQDGLLGFWKGVIPSLFMVSNPTIQYVIYEWLMKRLRHLRVTKKPSPPTTGEIFLASSLAKTVATVLTYPMLTIKSRLQVARRHADGSEMYSGTLDAVKKILRIEGLRGFYRGMKWKLVQSVIAAAILFVSKEEIAMTVRSLLTKSATS